MNHNFNYSYGPITKLKNKVEFINDVSKLYKNGTSTKEIIKYTNKILNNIPLSRLCCNSSIRDKIYGDKKINLILPSKNGSIERHRININEKNLKLICEKAYEKMNEKIDGKRITEQIINNYDNQETIYNESKTNEKKNNPSMCDAFYTTYCKYVYYLMQENFTDPNNNIDVSQIPEYGINNKLHDNECGCINSPYIKLLEYTNKAKETVKTTKENMPYCYDNNCSLTNEKINYVYMTNYTKNLSKNKDCPSQEICMNQATTGDIKLKDSNMKTIQTCNFSNGGGIKVPPKEAKPEELKPKEPTLKAKPKEPEPKEPKEPKEAISKTKQQTIIKKLTDLYKKNKYLFIGGGGASVILLILCTLIIVILVLFI